MNDFSNIACSCITDYINSTTNNFIGCSPLNNCVNNNGGCGPFGVCSSTGPGASNCSCETGYIYSGGTCVSNAASTASVVGPAVGVSVGAIILILVIIWYYRRKQNKAKDFDQIISMLGNNIKTQSAGKKRKPREIRRRNLRLFEVSVVQVI